MGKLTWAILALAMGGCSVSLPGRLDKDKAATMLQEVAEMLNSKKYAAAMDHFLIPTKAGSAEKVLASLETMIPNGEISDLGVKMIVERGEYGPLEEILGPMTDTRLRSAYGVKGKTCTAFRLRKAEVGFCPDEDGRYRIVRLDDLATLAKLYHEDKEAKKGDGSSGE